VTFRFFKVAELVPDGDAIGSMRVTRQVALGRAPTIGAESDF
jgi:hypothetical protein